MWGAALLIMSALAMSATAAEFKAATSPVEVTASQTTVGVFRIDGSAAQCGSVKFESIGGVSLPSPTLEVHPTYGGCIVFGEVGGTISTSGCNYLLHASGSADVICTGTSSIELSAPHIHCRATVSGQSGLASVTYHDEGGLVKIDLSLAALVVDKTEDGLLCPLLGTGIVTSSTYVGSIKAAGAHAGVSDSIEVS